jgi:hypothetical protein
MCEWWCVLLTVPALLASAQGPSYGHCYNSTLVAAEPFDPSSLSSSPGNQPAPTVQFSSSVVESGELKSPFPPLLSHLISSPFPALLSRPNSL